MPEQKAPTVILVGRTNVGKSTLFNRLLEEHKALVSATAGTTRDRNEGNCLWRGMIVRIVDTGGLDVDKTDSIELSTVEQAERGIAQADLILFVVDVKSGPMPQEQELAAKLRDQKKPVIVVGNKAETAAERMSVELPEWRIQGLPTPIPVSSIRGTGVGDMLDAVYEKLEEIGKPPIESIEIDAIKIAVIGKPNVGKSSLINAIVGEERFIASPIAHTTREPNDTLIQFKDKNYIFVDTAGMRKKGKVKKAGGLEAAAVIRNERSIKQADVAILVVDASEPIGTQEKTLAGLLKDSGVGVIIVANKWDLIEDKDTNTMKEYRHYMAQLFPFLRWAPVVFVSALKKQRVKNLFEMIDEVQKNRMTVISENELGLFLQGAIRKHLPTKGKGPAPPKILGLKQSRTGPPVFKLIIKAHRTDVVASSYIRYLSNSLREKYGLTGTPVFIRIQFASSVSK